MNAVERVRTALQNRQPDRVPVIEFIVDENVWTKAVPGAIDMADAMDRLDMDGVGCGACFARVSESADGTCRDDMAIVRRAIRGGADVIVLGDDYAANNGPMFSPDLLRSFIVPRLRAMIDMIHEEGALVIKHSDGNIYPILNDLVDCGPDGINPIEPVAGMDLKTVKRLVGDRVCIAGNIDCAKLLPFGTREAVFEAVRQAIADAGAGGGYIVTSSNSIHSSCNPANFVAMIEAVHEYGSY